MAIDKPELLPGGYRVDIELSHHYAVCVSNFDINSRCQWGVAGWAGAKRAQGAPDRKCYGLIGYRPDQFKIHWNIILLVAL